MDKVNFELMTEKGWDKLLQDLDFNQKPTEMWVYLQHE